MLYANVPFFQLYPRSKFALPTSGAVDRDTPDYLINGVGMM